MQKYAVVIRNQDNYQDCGTEIGITTDIDAAKKYLKKVYDTCIDQVNSSIRMKFLKTYIDDNHTMAELEWESEDTHTIFSSDVFITETFDI